jgi:hypothetical protein
MTELKFNDPIESMRLVWQCEDFGNKKELPKKDVNCTEKINVLFSRDVPDNV